MTELNPHGGQYFRPNPVQSTRSDMLDYQQETKQPPPGAQNTNQMFINLSYNFPRMDYMGDVNGRIPEGYGVRSVPQGTTNTNGLVGGSNVPLNKAGEAVRTSAERLRQWLLGIRQQPSPFPTTTK